MNSAIDSDLADLQRRSAAAREFVGQGERSFDELASELSRLLGTQRRCAPAAFAEEARRSLPYDAQRLNEQERALFWQDPIAGVQVLAAGSQALEIAESEWDAATLYHGNGDAFRHALWNWLMKNSVGEASAKAWGDAHENGAPANPPLEKAMDLFNNQKGRELSATTGGRSQLIEMTALGELRRIVGSALAPTNGEGKL